MEQYEGKIILSKDTRKPENKPANTLKTPCESLISLFYKYNVATEYKESSFPNGDHYVDRIRELMGDCHLTYERDSFCLNFELGNSLTDYISIDSISKISDYNRRSIHDYSYRYTPMEVYGFNSYYRSGSKKIYIEDWYSKRFSIDLGLDGTHLFYNDVNHLDVQRFFEKYINGAYRHAYEMFYRELFNEHKRSQTSLVTEAYHKYLENSNGEVMRYFHNIIDSEFIIDSDLKISTLNNHSFVLNLVLGEDCVLMNKLEVWSLIKDSIKRIEGMSEDYDIKIMSKDFNDSNISIYIGLNLYTIKKEIEGNLQLENFSQKLDKLLELKNK